MKYRALYRKNMHADFDRKADVDQALCHGYSAMRLAEQVERRICFPTPDSCRDFVGQVDKSVANLGGSVRKSDGMRRRDYYYDTQNYELYNRNESLRVIDLLGETNKSRLFKVSALPGTERCGASPFCGRDEIISILVHWSPKRRKTSPNC